MERETSLYEAIGGAAALTAAVEEFYLRALANPKLAAYFAHTSLERLRVHQHEFLTALLDGPRDVAGLSMREAHAGLGISGADFDRMVQHLVDTLGHQGIAPALAERVVAGVGPVRAEIVER